MSTSSSNPQGPPPPHPELHTHSAPRPAWTPHSYTHQVYYDRQFHRCGRMWRRGRGGSRIIWFGLGIGAAAIYHRRHEEHQTRMDSWPSLPMGHDPRPEWQSNMRERGWFCRRDPSLLPQQSVQQPQSLKSIIEDPIPAVIPPAAATAATSATLNTSTTSPILESPKSRVLEHLQARLGEAIERERQEMEQQRSIEKQVKSEFVQDPLAKEKKERVHLQAANEEMKRKVAALDEVLNGMTQRLEQIKVTMTRN